MKREWAVTASERLKALQEGFHERLSAGTIGREPYTLFAALPELIAVVEEAEKAERALASVRGNVYPDDLHLLSALAALDAKLSVT